MTDDHKTETAAGRRFEFGKNWARFLAVLDDQRIETARRSVQSLLKVDTLEGKRFLDAGSGSGLFSLVARQLGATVTSFDFDPDSVACTKELQRRYFPDDPNWTVTEESVLDSEFLSSLGQFDVVYSWGVLHHTGEMWQALENVAPLVADDGLLAISIYNDQGSWSRRWTKIKKIYNRLPSFLQPLFFAAVMIPRELRYLLLSTLALRPGDYFRNISQYASKSLRGMSYWHDLKDWIGGYPFEVAKPEEVFSFFQDRGFELINMAMMGGGSGCNEFVFRKRNSPEYGS